MAQTSIWVRGQSPVKWEPQSGTADFASVFTMARRASIPNRLQHVPQRGDRIIGEVEVLNGGSRRAVWFPPGLKHWHGASPTTATTHMAVQESSAGKNVDWVEKVSDDQYRK